MNNKGFTLVELLAVIVVLAVIITIAVSSYSSIQRSVNDQQYENVISYIKTKAVTYAKTNNFKINNGQSIYMNVDGLIKRGFIEPDDDDNNLKNPNGDGTLNSLCVKITYKGNHQYEAEIEQVNTKCNNELPYIE